MNYDVNDGGEVSVTITDRDGALADPVTLSLVIRTPAGVNTTVTLAGGGIVRDSIGKFRSDLTYTEAGTWRFRWTASGGSVPGTGEYETFVRTPRF